MTRKKQNPAKPAKATKCRRCAARELSRRIVGKLDGYFGSNEALEAVETIEAMLLSWIQK